MSDTSDVLEFFYALDKQKEAAKKPPKDERTYPGATPPRNTVVIDTGQDSWLNGLPSHEFIVGGEVRKFYTIGALARSLGKSTVTIRSWEAKGWLPPAGFRTPTPLGEQVPGKTVKGKRLYSQAQVVFLAEAYEKYILNPRMPNWQGFRHHIKTQYPR